MGGSVVLTGAVACLGLCLLLGVTIASRKDRRDRRETRMHARRRLAADAILARDGDALAVLFASARRDADAQVDLAAALEQVAARCGRAHVNALRRQARASGLRDALAQQIGSRRPLRRGRAALLTGLLQLADVCELVGPVLEDPDPDVKLAAVRALALRRDRRAAELLIEALETGAIPPARIVERIGHPWAVPSLLQALRRPRGPEASPRAGVRASLAQALGLAGAAEAERDLVALLHRGCPEERTSAARALAAVGGRSAVPALSEALQDEHWPVRAQAATALGALGSVDTVPAVAVGLTDSNWWVRANAGRALRALGEPGVSALRWTAASDVDRFAQDRAREELAKVEIAGIAA